LLRFALSFPPNELPAWVLALAGLLLLASFASSLAFWIELMMAVVSCLVVSSNSDIAFHPALFAPFVALFLADFVAVFLGKPFPANPLENGM
jgi:hypothetical protein